MNDPVRRGLLRRTVIAKIEDAPIFTEAVERSTKQQHERLPMLEVIRSHPRNLLLAIGIKLVESIWYWIVATFSVTYLSYLGVQTGRILLLTAQFVTFFVIVFFGHVDDRVGVAAVISLVSLLFVRETRGTSPRAVDAGVRPQPEVVS